jgi:hypothetical protein
MGLSYKIVYKKGCDNRVANALSRVSNSDTCDISTISVIKPLWLQDIQQGYAQDDEAQQLLSELSVHSPQGSYSLQDGLIKYKGRIWLGNTPSLHSKVFNSLHSSAVGVTLGLRLLIKESNTYLHGLNSNSLLKP